MGNSEVLRGEIISSSDLPPEPFVEVRTDGEVTRFTLTQALQQIQEIEEKRRGELSQKARNIGKVRLHGSTNPLSQRVQNDVRKSLEREIRRNPPASSYPLVLCILKSHPDNPLQIPGEISPRSECFPKEGKEDPFYRFICDRPVEEALRLLNQPPETIKTLWEIFSQRLELHQKVLRGEVSPSDALDQYMKEVEKVTFPEHLTLFVREIGERFPLISSRNHRRRF